MTLLNLGKWGRAKIRISWACQYQYHNDFLQRIFADRFSDPGRAISRVCACVCMCVCPDNNYRETL